MKAYEMELCGVRRTLPFIPINDTTAFASFVVLSDTELVSACAPEMARRIGAVDAIVTAEAKGIAWPTKSASCWASKNSSWPARAPRAT